MKRVVSIAIALSSILVACGGAKDSGLFGGAANDGGGGNPSTTHDAAGSGDDAGAIGDDASEPADTSTPPNDATTGGPDGSACGTDQTNGSVEVNAENVGSYTLGNSSWSQNGQNGDNFMKAAYGEKCDGQVNLTVFNQAGTFDVTKRMLGAGVVEGPVITIQRADGTTYVAGYDLAAQCNPCGSGTISVTSWAVGKVSGTFDVEAQKVGSGQTRRISGTFSFHH